MKLPVPLKEQPISATWSSVGIFSMMNSELVIKDQVADIEISRMDMQVPSRLDRVGGDADRIEAGKPYVRVGLPYMLVELRGVTNAG